MGARQGNREVIEREDREGLEGGRNAEVAEVAEGRDDRVRCGKEGGLSASEGVLGEEGIHH